MRMEGARSNVLLLVASDPSEVASVRYRLDRDGLSYALATAATLREALEKVRRARHHCILTGLDLPDASGVGIVEALAAAAPTVPIVAGADEHLADSLLDGNVLTRTIGHAVARRRAAAQRPVAENQRAALDSLLGLILRYADLAGTAGDLGTVSRNLRGLRGAAEQARDLVLMDAVLPDPRH
jgi:CheY-like chemotaxis protein